MRRIVNEGGINDYICPICKSNNIQIDLSGTSDLGDAYFEMYQCEDCQSVFTFWHSIRYTHTEIEEEA